MRLFRSLCLLTLALLLSTGLPLQAERVLPSFNFAPGSGIEMRVTNFYEELPPFGFLPLRVEVKNSSGQTRKWDFRTSHSQANFRTFISSTTLEVPTGSERTFDLLVPLAPQAANSSRFSNLRIELSGYAVVNGSTSDHSSSSGRPPTSFTGMGEALAVKNWGPLRDLMEKTHLRALDGSSLDPDFLPADWRGLAGFEILFFTEAEWRGIGAAERGAIDDWINQGGKLVLVHTDASAPPDLPRAGNHGLGSIELWPLGDDFIERAAQLLKGTATSLSTETLQNYTWQWNLAEKVGRAQPPQILIMVFVIAFGVIIGPLNFLVLAPLGKRHRLFWTTPLLSIAASLLMALFIIFSEGLGGSGRRLEAQLSLAGQNKAVLWQEQVSRTGVLTGNSFTPSQPSIILPVGLRQSTNPGSYRAGADRGSAYVLNGTVWSGDWFRSRNTQAQVFSAVIQTRGRLQVQADPSGTPVALSSFDKILEEVWYFDQQGAAWRGLNLSPGEKQPLKPANKDDHAKWWKKTLQDGGPVIRSRSEEYAKGEKAGKFFAVTKATTPITSLPSIRWKDSGGIIFGEVTQ